jgi:hypothetical protein
VFAVWRRRQTRIYITKRSIYNKTETGYISYMPKGNRNPVQSAAFKAANARVQFGSPLSTAKICAGSSKQNQRPCRNIAHYGLENCRFHLTPKEKGTLAQRPGHKSKPKTKAAAAAMRTIAAAPLGLQRLPIYQAARFWARAELARAWQAAQSGDARQWAEIVAKYAGHAKNQNETDCINGR